MPKPPRPPLTFYPAYCFPLSPTHNAWARLTAEDVHTLRERSGFEGQNLYFCLNHPIKWVRLVGVVVAVDVYPTRWIMVLDDSSGMNIEVTCGRSATRGSTGKDMAPNGLSALRGATGAGDESQLGTTATGRMVDLKGVDVGAVVKVKGGIGKFREEKQVILERLSLIHTTTEEATAWAELAQYRNDVLSKPWVLSEKEQIQAKRKAEGRDRHRERKEREKRKRLKEKAKDNTHFPVKESEMQDHVGGEETIREKGKVTKLKAKGDRQRQCDRNAGTGIFDSKGATIRVPRPAASGRFDALGL